MSSESYSPPDPWRYRCPVCRSAMVDRVARGDLGRGRPAGGPYYCRSCTRPRHSLYDAKTGEEVSRP